jgi:membrane protein YdbS with pleckstrin-like domain
MSGFHSLLVRLLHIPPKPQPPPGSPDSLTVFRAAPAYYQYSIIKWAIKQLTAILGILVSLGGFSFTVGLFEGLPDDLWWLEAFAIGVFVAQAIGSFVLLKLNYELRWYMVSDRSLRIREGIFRVREQTMTVANIQNMEVRQGPLQRLFGIADLEVRTAGGSTSKKDDSNQAWKEDPHLGSFRGLDNAEEVRNLIADSLRRYRDSGLGDPDGQDEPLQAPPLSVDQASRSSTPRAGSGLAAAQRLLEEVRGLRAAMR